VQLCCLADANSRLSSINTADITYLDNWIAEGKSILEKSTKKLESLNRRRASLEELSSPQERSDTSSPSSSSVKSNRVIDSHLSSSSSFVLPALNRGKGVNLPFPPISSAGPPLLLVSKEHENGNEKSTSLSLLQREYETQSSQLKFLVEREREAKKVRIPNHLPHFFIFILLNSGVGRGSSCTVCCVWINDFY
jgi:hypothetical protein